MTEMTCLSRKDPNKDIFNTQKRKRWNFYPLLRISNGTLFCDKERYDIKDLCYVNAFDQKCTINGVKVELSVHPE